MMRSELIPQTNANLGTGTLFYHFSLQTKEENAPVASLEHQIAFFEVLYQSFTFPLFLRFSLVHMLTNGS
jgi:hypothetical protein